MLPVQFIAGADPDLVEAVQHVQLGQGDAVHPAGDAGLAHQHRVKPAAAALAPRHRAELMAALAQLLAGGVLQFGGEGAFAHARRIALDDAQHRADGAGADARARRRLARHRVGRGDEGIGAVVDVQQHRLRTLEQHALAGLARRVQLAPGRTDIGRDTGRDAVQRRQQRARIHFRRAKTLAQHIVVRQQALDLAGQRRRILQVDGADGAPSHLVFIGRADAALCGAQLLAGRFLAQRIQFAVQRQHQHRVFRQDQDVGCHRKPRRAGLCDFLQQRPGIDHHAIADDAALALHHARRQQRQLVGLFAHHDGVAGIVAALEAHHHLGAV